MSDKLWDVDPSGATVLYEWAPQPDITAYELALCMPILSSRLDSGTQGHSVATLPDAAKRHFKRLG